MILNSPTISGSLTVTGNIIASGSITLSGSVASASYAASASNALAAQTASYVLTAQTASFVALAQSASNAVSAATASFANAFTVAGTLTAQTLVVQTITSSVLYSSGSNVFGNNISNTQIMTGSLLVTGSSIFSGSVALNGTLTAGLANGNIRLKGSTDGFLGVGVSNDILYLADWTTTAKGLSIVLSTGAATFSSTLITGGKITVNGGGLLLDLNGGSDTSLRVTGNRGNGDNLHIANIEFYNSFSTRLVGEMRGITGAGGTQSNSGQLVFYTNDNGTYAERMRISSGGLVYVGTNLQTYGRLNIGSTGTQLYNGITIYSTDGTESFLGLGCSGTTAGINVTYGSTGSYLPFVAIVAGSERMRITTTGGLGIGTTTVTGTTRLRAINSSAVNGDPLFFSDNNVYNAIGLYSAGADGYNGAACVMIMGRNTTNSRSINAGGTINASGTDYAEYMTKDTTDNIVKGDIVGINSNGLLTNIFVDSISFVVKSTDPSYVGGDTWGSVDDIGKLSLEATEEEKAEYNTKLEAARAKVDRIAFSGQVPCNVTGATVGDYIIPIELENGKIGGQAVTNPTFEQYQKSVGKVWKIMENGKAWIAVKIG